MARRTGDFDRLLQRASSLKSGGDRDIERKTLATQKHSTNSKTSRSPEYEMYRFEKRGEDWSDAIIYVLNNPQKTVAAMARRSRSKSGTVSEQMRSMVHTRRAQLEWLMEEKYKKTGMRWRPVFIEEGKAVLTAAGKRNVLSMDVIFTPVRSATINAQPISPSYQEQRGLRRYQSNKDRQQPSRERGSAETGNPDHEDPDPFGSSKLFAPSGKPLAYQSDSGSSKLPRLDAEISDNVELLDSSNDFTPAWTQDPLRGEFFQKSGRHDLEESGELVQEFFASSNSLLQSRLDILDTSPRKLEDEGEKFFMWAANVGLFAVGADSLDSRLRNEYETHQYVANLLEELIEYLQDLCNLLEDENHSPHPKQITERGLTSDSIADRTPDFTDAESLHAEVGLDPFESPGDIWTEVRLPLSAISDIMSRLFKVASSIPNPKSPPGSPHGPTKSKSSRLAPTSKFFDDMDLSKVPGSAKSKTPKDAEKVKIVSEWPRSKPRTRSYDDHLSSRKLRVERYVNDREDGADHSSDSWGDISNDDADSETFETIHHNERGSLIRRPTSPKPSQQPFREHYRGPQRPRTRYQSSTEQIIIPKPRVSPRFNPTQRASYDDSIYGADSASLQSHSLQRRYGTPNVSHPHEIQRVNLHVDERPEEKQERHRLRELELDKRERRLEERETELALEISEIQQLDREELERQKRELKLKKRERQRRDEGVEWDSSEDFGRYY